MICYGNPINTYIQTNVLLWTPRTTYINHMICYGTAVNTYMPLVAVVCTPHCRSGCRQCLSVCMFNLFICLYFGLTDHLLA